jgi:antitoxin Phd
MAQRSWSVQDAKNRFSEVVEAVRRAPQTVTKHGKPAVVVVECERLRRLERAQAPSFALLAMPQRSVAEVTVGEEERLVHENESAYIPIGSVHRSANPGKIPLELIVVQVDSYLREDDILQLDDVYQRHIVG